MYSSKALKHYILSSPHPILSSHGITDTQYSRQPEEKVSGKGEELQKGFKSLGNSP